MKDRESTLKPVRSSITALAWRETEIDIDEEWAHLMGVFLATVHWHCLWRSQTMSGCARVTSLVHSPLYLG